MAHAPPHDVEGCDDERNKQSQRKEGCRSHQIHSVCLRRRFKAVCFVVSEWNSQSPEWRLGGQRLWFE